MFIRVAPYHGPKAWPIEKSGSLIRTAEFTSCGAKCCQRAGSGWCYGRMLQAVGLRLPAS